MRVCFLKREKAVESFLRGKGLITALSGLCGLDRCGDSQLVVSMFTRLLEVQNLDTKDGLAVLPCTEETWNSFIAILNGAVGRLLSQPAILSEIHTLCTLFPAARRILSSFATLKPEMGADGLRYLVAVHAVFSDADLDARKLQLYEVSASQELEDVFRDYSHLLLEFGMHALLRKISAALPFLLMEYGKCEALGNMCPILAAGPGLLQFLAGQEATESLEIHIITENNNLHPEAPPVDQSPLYPLPEVAKLPLHLRTTAKWSYGIDGFDSLSWDDFYESEHSAVLSKLEYRTVRSFQALLEDYKPLQRRLQLLIEQTNRISTDLYERVSGIYENLEKVFQSTTVARSSPENLIRRTLLSVDRRACALLIGSTIYTSPELAIQLQSAQPHAVLESVKGLKESIPELLLSLREPDAAKLRQNFERFLQPNLLSVTDDGIRLKCPLHIVFRSLEQQGDSWYIADDTERRNALLLELWLAEYRLRLRGCERQDRVFLSPTQRLVIPALITAKSSTVCLIVSGLDNIGHWGTYWLIPSRGILC